MGNIIRPEPQRAIPSPESDQTTKRIWMSYVVANTRCSAEERVQSLRYLASICPYLENDPNPAVQEVLQSIERTMSTSNYFDPELSRKAQRVLTALSRASQ